MFGRGTRPLRAFARRFAIALIAAAACMVGAVVGVNSVIDNQLDKIPRIHVATAPEPPGGANYLLIGSDSRAFVKDATDEQIFGDPKAQPETLSDTMMVIHVEPAAKRTLIVSFPRDLWVSIPGTGRMAKINSAFNGASGGPQRVIKTIEQNFGIGINHYLEVDFRSFEGIVNAIGTVPVYVPAPAIDQFTGFVAVNAGCYHLDGYDALQWVRARHIAFLDPKTGKMVEDARADIGRIARQQDFIRRLAGLAVRKSLANPLTANDIAGNVVRHLKVDQGLSKDDIFRLIDAFRTINPDDTSALDFETFQGRLGTAGGQSVLFPEMDRMRPLLDRLRTFDTGAAASSVSPSEVRLRVLNGSGKPGQAKAALRGFEQLGFRGEGTDDDPRGSVALGEVRYAKGELAAAKLVLTYISPAARLVRDASLDGTSADVVVVLGTDFDHIAVPSGGSAGVTPATAAAPAPTTGRATTATTAAGTAPGTAPAGGSTGDPAASCR
ncbi:MAG TPA: LCP family protein [Acidimicrobiia bacterium]|nr:LCP family protein [Acidimicrobiia bacterium]